MTDIETTRWNAGPSLEASSEPASLDYAKNRSAFEEWLKREYPEGLTAVERSLAHDGWDAGYGYRMAEDRMTHTKIAPDAAEPMVPSESSAFRVRP